MKNKVLLISLMLVLLGSLLVCSCAKSAPTPAPTPAPAPAAPAPAAPAPAKVYEWRLQGALPGADSEHSLAYAKFCQAVEANTKGRVKIKLFEAGAIVQAPELMNATRDGVMEACLATTGYYSGAIPLLGVIPGLTLLYVNHFDAINILYDYGLSELSRPAYTKYGVNLVGHYIQSCDGYGLLTVKPVSTLAGLKGLKIRTFGPHISFFQKLGASTVNIPLTEVYTAAATGVIDGATNNWGGNIDFKFYEVMKNGMLPELSGAGVGHFLVNPKAWDALPADLQTIISLTFHDWNWWLTRSFQPYIRGGHDLKINMLKEKGVNWITLSADDQAKMLKDAMAVWDEEAAKDQLSAKGIAIVKDYYKKIGRFK